MYYGQDHSCLLKELMKLLKDNKEYAEKNMVRLGDNFERGYSRCRDDFASYLFSEAVQLCAAYDVDVAKLLDEEEEEV